MTLARYDDIAEWYDEKARDWSYSDGPVASGVFELAGDIVGRRICDLGCGQGALARELARRGSAVLGVDISEKLLRIARGYEIASPLSVDYVHDDAGKLSKLSDSDFDGVVCNWSLVDIADLESCLRATARILRPRGWFVFSMPHPCFLPRDSVWPLVLDMKVEHLLHNYSREGFSPPGDEGVRGVGIRARVGRFYRTLGTYLNSFANAGFVLDRVIEIPGASAFEDGKPAADALPPIMLARYRKP